MIEIIVQNGVVVEVYDHEDELSPTPLREGLDYFIKDLDSQEELIDTPLGDHQAHELENKGSEIL